MSRLEALLSELRRFYGLLPSPPRDPFQLFVWEVLSVHSTPKKRDATLVALTRLRALTPDAMWRTPEKKLGETLALAGPRLEERLHALRVGIDVFRRAPDLPLVIQGPFVTARRALRRLPHMDEGGAHRMLLFAADHPVLPVDARMGRVARRLGYGERVGAFAKMARSVRDAIARELPEDVDVYRRTYVYLSHHGSAACREARPHCLVCPLNETCQEGQKRLLIAD